MIVLALAALVSAQCVAIDGDTLSCLTTGHRRVHVRLNGIDAPELAGHCRKTRICAPGDPLASKANLKGLVDGQDVRWRSLGKDLYHRTIAEPRANGIDLSCAQLTGGFAIYKPKWDNRHALIANCPAARLP